ncbi:MAG TPA: DUF883 family protein [Burkholderiaceae bacterium]|nr:DUF883 family protein [Burkholderiaceae bacterium]
MATNDRNGNDGNDKMPSAQEVKDGVRDLGRDVKDAVRSGTSSDADAERRAMREDRERLAYDFREMVSSAEALLHSTAKYTGAEIEEARERLQQQLDFARERSGDLKESVRDAGQHFASKADECVRQHPWQSVGVAFVLGMLFAHCTGRSRDY